MAFAFDELFAYGGQLIVAAKKRVPKALGIGEEKIDHSAYIEGNTQIGKVDAFSNAMGTLMVGREGTKGTDKSLYVKQILVIKVDLLLDLVLLMRDQNHLILNIQVKKDID